MKTFMVTILVVFLAFNVSPLNAEKKIVMDGSTTVGPIAKAFAEYYMSMNKDVNITVSESGSGNGAKSLINGAIRGRVQSTPNAIGYFFSGKPQRYPSLFHSPNR
jgi:ABC-type phosphate transport system substrate-binding protein